MTNRIETTAYYNRYGGFLWSEPMQYQRLWRIGQEFVLNSKTYHVLGVVVDGGDQIVTLEEKEAEKAGCREGGHIINGQT